VELAALGARVPTAELRDQVRGLEAKRQRLLEQLAPLRDGSRKVRMVTAEEQQRVESEWKKWQRQAIVRKRICRELWERCTEVLPEGVRSKAELWESLGLEGQL
jgi:26S proteasome regulatory subunit (ATPase 3-interacting protein)